VVGEPRALKNDVIGTDGVVVLLDGQVDSILGSLCSDNLIKTLNYSLLALRPSDLEDRNTVRNRLNESLNAIADGDYDAMFSRVAAERSQLGPEHTFPASAYREWALATLLRYRDHEDALGELITSGRQAVAECRRRGVRPTDDAALDAIKTSLEGNPGLLPDTLDRVFAGERIPFVLYDQASTEIHLKKLPEVAKGKLAEARHLAVEPAFLSENRNDRNWARFMLSYMMTNAFRGRPIQSLSAETLENLPGCDYRKVKYELDRKRDELDRHRKRTGHRIPMWPDSMRIALHNANTARDIPDDGSASSAIGALAETHYLLTHHAEDPERRLIRGRFDHATAFHDAAMDHILRKAEEHLQQTRLPPMELSDPAESAPGDTRREPISPEAAIAIADRFARERLPECHRLACLFQPAPDHPIVVKLYDEAGNPSQTVIRTFEPDADRALDIKRRIQAHLLNLPGIVPYRGPMQEGGYRIAQDELIPAQPPRDRIVPKYGEYRLQLSWPDRREEMTLSLGLTYSADNQEEAQRRAGFVRDRLAAARDAQPGQPYLPLTRRDVAFLLRSHVLAANRPWQELTHGEIERFPAALRFPFPTDRSQESWLQVEPLQTDGNPNYTWVLPMHVMVGGQRLANASTHVNLHVRDRHAAEERAIETVNHFMGLVSALPRHARWAVDREQPQRLQSLSEAARAAAPELLDTNRLKDLQNELRGPYKQDLCVALTAPPREQDGRVRFTLGVRRGGAHGLSEPVLVPVPDDVAPPPIERSFSVPAGHAGEIPRFVDAVNATFRGVIGEEYSPRSDRNFDQERMRKIKAPRPFKPAFAPRVFEDAVASRMPEFPQFTTDGPAPGRMRPRRRPGDEPHGRGMG
jgi:hypothetical protein